MYDQYPRRYGKSKKIVYSKQEFVELVNRDNGYGDVFVSVFYYNNLKEVGGIYKIDSESAVVDKIFIDMDIKDWVNMERESLLEFRNNLSKIIKKMKLKRKEMLVVKKVLQKVKLKDEEKKVIIEVYCKHDKPNAEKRIFERVLKLELILRKQSILRIWCYSGGGFHLYVYIENRPENKKYFYRNVVEEISKWVCEDDEYYVDEEDKERKRKLWDIHCPPKLSQMARVIGTKNPKRGLFCISLTEEDFDLGFEHIKNEAKKQRTKINYLGNKLMKFSDDLDEAGILESCSAVIDAGLKEYPEDLKPLLESLGVLWDEVPLCIKRFLVKNSDLVYVERYFLITFLYLVGLTENEIKEVLKIVLIPKKLYHCCGIVKDNYKPPSREKSRIETQIPDIIESDYWLSCGQVRLHGFCDPRCKLKEVMYHFI